MASRRERLFHPTKQVVDAISKDRPHWQELRYEQYLEQIGPNGAMFVGNPDQVAEKLICMIEDLNLDRFCSIYRLAPCLMIKF